MASTVLRGNLSTLRPWRPEDAPSLSQHASSRAIWRNLGDAFPHPYPVEQAEEYIAARAADEGPQRVFALDVAGEAVGCTGIHPQQNEESRTAAIGYWLGEPFWGRGIMTEAVGLLVGHAFATFSFHRLQAGVYGWNPASARVLEKNGFTMDGRLRQHVFHDGEYTDEMLFGLLRKDAEETGHD